MSIIRGGDDCDIGCDRVDRGDAQEASCQVGVTFTAGAVPRRRTEFSSSRASGERTGVCSAERLSLPLGAKERPDTADFFDCGKHPLDLPRTAEPERDFRGPALMVNAHVRRSDMFWVRSTSVALISVRTTRSKLVSFSPWWVPVPCTLAQPPARVFGICTEATECRVQFRLSQVQSSNSAQEVSMRVAWLRSSSREHGRVPDGLSYKASVLSALYTAYLLCHFAPSLSFTSTRPLCKGITCLLGGGRGWCEGLTWWIPRYDRCGWRRARAPVLM